MVIFVRHMCRQQVTGDGERVTALTGACRRHYVVIGAAGASPPFGGIKNFAARRHLKRINSSTHQRINFTAKAEEFAKGF